MSTEVEKLHERAVEIVGDEPVIKLARARAKKAVTIAAAAVHVDPTLLDEDRRRDIDLLGEMLRQLKPLARQSAATIEHARLTAASAPVREFARIGRVNPDAPDELDALSEHAVVIAERVAKAAQPDWNSPRRIRERSERLLPSSRELAALADRLHNALRPAISLAYPAPAAIQLAALADQLHAAAQNRHPRTCAAPGCGRQVVPASTGRPRTYCGSTCRQRAHRAAVNQPVIPK